MIAEAAALCRLCAETSRLVATVSHLATSDAMGWPRVAKRVRQIEQKVSRLRAELDMAHQEFGASPATTRALVTLDRQLEVLVRRARDD
jgi:hypothetical protein